MVTKKILNVSTIDLAFVKDVGAYITAVVNMLI